MVRAGKTPQICKGNGDQKNSGKLHDPPGGLCGGAKGVPGPPP